MAPSLSYPTILIIGKDGQVGYELLRVMAPLGNVVAMGRSDVNLSDNKSIRTAISNVAPDVIINAAAYTAVDRAEDEPELAMQINGTAPGIMAEEAEKIGALFIHYSTDYIFDGTKENAYTERDIPNPVNIYGASKLAGEVAVRATKANHIILRTSWVYSARGHNFLLSMLKLIRDRDELRVVSDQVGAPTWARTIAERTAQIVSQSLSEIKSGEFKSETYNLSASGKTSWHGFATKIMEIISEYGKQKLLRTKNISPIGSDEYKTAAQRPKNSCMSTELLEEKYCIKMEKWDLDLKNCLLEILAQDIN